MGVHFPARVQIFLVARPSLRPIQASSYSVAFVALFIELKQPQGKADHSKHLSDEFRTLHPYNVALRHQENFVFMWG
jgi:hypothetical protein